MAAYLFVAYDVTNSEEYQKYNPGSLAIIRETLLTHGGNVLVSGADHQWSAGGRDVAVLLEFPTAEAANAFQNDPAYLPAKAIRLASTSNRIELVCSQFVRPVPG